MSEKLGQRKAKSESRSKEAVISVMSEVVEKLPRGSAEELIEDLRRVQSENDGKFISRNFYRGQGRYTESAWNGRFGTFEEFKRQAGLDLPRGARLIELQTARHAASDVYKGFQEVELNPLIGLYEKLSPEKGVKTIVIASDFHGGATSNFAMKVLLDTIRRTQPDVVCLAGDVFDLYEFSRFDQDPRQCNLKGEFDIVKNEIFKPIREAAGPKCMIDMILGNHENRLLRHLADRTPYMKVLMDLMGVSLADLLGVHDSQINLISRADIAVFRPSEKRDEIKKNYKTYFNLFSVTHDAPKGAHYGLCGASGHTHKPSTIASVDERFGGKFWLTLGCMAKIDAEYVEGLSQYQNGFAVVHVDTEGKSVVGENVIFSDTMAVVGSKVYLRRDYE